MGSGSSSQNPKKSDPDYVAVPRVDDGWSDRSITDETDLDLDTLVEVLPWGLRLPWALFPSI